MKRIKKIFSIGFFFITLSGCQEAQNFSSECADLGVHGNAKVLYCENFRNKVEGESLTKSKQWVDGIAE